MRQSALLGLPLGRRLRHRLHSLLTGAELGSVVSGETSIGLTTACKPAIGHDVSQEKKRNDAYAFCCGISCYCERRQFAVRCPGACLPTWDFVEPWSSHGLQRVRAWCASRRAMAQAQGPSRRQAVFVADQTAPRPPLCDEQAAIPQPSSADRMAAAGLQGDGQGPPVRGGPAPCGRAPI
jgi:hypothetical protein